MNTYKDDRYFRSNSLYTSAFLLSKDQILVDVDKVTDPRKAQFIFLDSPERESLLQNFNFGKENSPEVQVDARKLIQAIKTLKDKLYQEF